VKLIIIFFFSVVFSTAKAQSAEDMPFAMTLTKQQYIEMMKNVINNSEEIKSSMGGLQEETLKKNMSEERFAEFQEMQKQEKLAIKQREANCLGISVEKLESLQTSVLKDKQANLKSIDDCANTLPDTISFEGSNVKEFEVCLVEKQAKKVGIPAEKLIACGDQGNGY